MTRHEPARRLIVRRTLADGRQVVAGTLAQNRDGVYFAYDPAYLQAHGNLSPYHLRADGSVQAAPRDLPHRLHGVFADSLPDGWGMLLQDRHFRQQGIPLAQITALDRLAYIGDRAIGALNYEPAWQPQAVTDNRDYAALGLAAQAIYDGETENILQELLRVGSSGGARPKAQIWMTPGDPHHCRTVAQPGDEAWLVKYTSRHIQPLGHEEGLCEAACLQLAERAGLEPCAWRLLPAPAQSGASHWLALKRFDCTAQGRHHLHSASGLLHADYRLPSLDYSDLLKMSKQLCRAAAVGQLQFARALFNQLLANHDDHGKNWAFLQDDCGNWQPAPFYDATYSPHPRGEHMTAFGGYGKAPPLKTMQQLAVQASFARWPDAQKTIQRIADTTASFSDTALALGVKKPPCATSSATSTTSGRKTGIYWRNPAPEKEKPPGRGGFFAVISVIATVVACRPSPSGR